MHFLDPMDVLTKLVSFSPGLVDGEEDGASGADVIDHFGIMIERLRPHDLEFLKQVAKRARIVEDALAEGADLPEDEDPCGIEE